MSEAARNYRVANAEWWIAQHFRNFAEQISEFEREYFFSPMNRTNWMKEFAIYLKSQCTETSND